MAVYYKFKSARDYDSISMDGPFISVGTLKEKIFETKHLGRGTDFDLVVINAQTNEEYLDEAMLIPKNTSVLVGRVPGRPRLPIVTEIQQKLESKTSETEPVNNSLPVANASAMKYTEDMDWDEFGNDLYSNLDALPVQSSNFIPEAPLTNNANEDLDSKIKAVVDTPALDWQRQGSDFGGGRSFGRGMGGRMGAGRGFGLEQKTPPQGYVCHRCKVPGHFIQHCPTNGDSNFDIKRVRQPTGIPRSMLMVNPQGSYALPNGSVAVLKPNEHEVDFHPLLENRAAFEKEIEGMPTSTRSMGDLPPELHCPLCSDVMKDAVLTSKCCFKSFCDKCIRDYIISRSICVCGATNILADDLLPNKTLRDTINRILESGNSSAENAGSTFQVQDMESARCPQPKIPSPTSSAASKGELKVLPVNEGTANIQEIADNRKAVTAPQQTSGQVRISRAADVSEATHESMSVKEQTSQGSARRVEEEVQQNLVPTEAGKKKKKKKIRLPTNDLQWKNPHNLAVENYMMPMGPPAGYNSYWNGMQPCMDGFMAPYAGPMQMMHYGPGPVDMPFASGFPPDPFGMQGYMMPPVPPHRDLAEFSMGMNSQPPAMSREQFDARKADLRRKRENDSPGGRVFSGRREYVDREVFIVGNGSSTKSKTKSSIPPPSSSSDYHPQRHRSERLSPVRSRSPPIQGEPPPPKRKSDRERGRSRERDFDDDHRDRVRDIHDQEHHHHRRHHRSESSSRKSTEPLTKTTTSSIAATAAADRVQKKSVFSRISFLSEEEVSKKRKVSTAPSSTIEEPSAAATATASASAASLKAPSRMATTEAAGRVTAWTTNLATMSDISNADRPGTRRLRRIHRLPIIEEQGSANTDSLI
ncbi:putative transcription factor interactor and regulator CCHC(Zn) family [Lupinus albus]|uniref:Putative transcription factor interactor and regulator CCHC(Zn) family n=1 Tax=Lupinus albus TaxID=3870 RepID=A0A6A4Q049_LUPAL|nr:putative transcription factor interactor and regulator CCHC(Zn) family [Lupinus albus]